MQLRTCLEDGGTPRLDRWGVDSEYGTLRDVLVGPITPRHPAILSVLGAAAGLVLWTAARAAAPVAAESTEGMVVSAQHVASDVGAAVLRDGGNAIDAAVAVGYALAVTHPCCGNLGGGGFITIHLANGKDTFINFRETAPQAASANMYLDSQGNPIAEKSINGYLAVGVPGTVLGLETAREKYGTLPRVALLKPAIRLAEQGFVLTRGDVDVLDEGTNAFRTEPNVAAVFLNHGIPFKPGDKLIQPQLAATLRIISDGGADAFYHGAIAEAIAAESQAHGGLLTKQDFAAYTVTESPPVTCTYRAYTVLSAPPPSSGGRPSVRDAASLGRLSVACSRLSFEPVNSLYDRSHALRLPRPQSVSGRSGVRRQPNRSLDIGYQRGSHQITYHDESCDAVGVTRRRKRSCRKRDDHTLLGRRSHGKCRIGHLHDQRRLRR